MAGWNTIQTIRKLEERADLLGLKFTSYKHDDMYGENVALVPKDRDALPIYSRDAVMFAGTLEHADRFMQGVLWARDYDTMVVDKNLAVKRERKEQDERNRQLLKMIKVVKPVTGDVE
ncbi:hypothetical protein UFOVP1636_271 [uncultured Caudovirales phage]|uniref:Uncharacterized protein n=1 Tax=uncultured Caudovirales phage TaxID=2100421 RepID=A0A6J5T1J1_9CAUD|nr:hypothetical protein UFOVP1636_271 [uncultured Caudovirales phage]